MRRGPAPQATETARGSARPHGFGALSVGSLVSGAAGYGVIALGTRAVGEVLFAPVSVLWSLWALSVAAVTFPVQHWTIRSAEAHGEQAVWSHVPRLFAAAVVIAVGGGAAALALGPRLFPLGATEFSVMTALLPLGGFVVGLQRGILTFRRRFGVVAVVIAAENGIRVLAALAVLVLTGATETGSTLLGWGIIAGFAIALVNPGALRPARDGEAAAAPGRASVRLLGGFAGANVAAQAALTSAPVVLALFSAPAPVITQTFAILALLRVPYTGFVGASAAVTGPLARLVDTGRAADIRRWEVRLVAVVGVLAVAAHVLAPYLLPGLVSLLFATTVTISPLAQGLLAAGGVLALAGLLEMLVLLALGRARRLLTAWGLGLTAGGLCLLVPTDPVLRVALAFVVAEAVALTAFVVNLPNRTAAPTPGA